MTGPVAPRSHEQIPPLNLDEIERRLAARSAEENGARQARLDAADIGRDAMTIGEHHLAAGDLDRAREFFTIAARHHAPDATAMLNTVSALIDATDTPEITRIAVGTDLDRPVADAQAERELVAQRAHDLVRRLNEIDSDLEQRIAVATREAAGIIANARNQAAATIADADRKAKQAIKAAEQTASPAGVLELPELRLAVTRDLRIEHA
jgi:hypothetical protein